MVSLGAGAEEEGLVVQKAEGLRVWDHADREGGENLGVEGIEDRVLGVDLVNRM